MNAAIVTIGDEILIGQIVDTNSAWISERLNAAGITVVEKRSIGDQHRQITDTLRELFQVVDLVVITGGLGPTKDDITKKTLADFFGCGMVRNEQMYEQNRARLAQRGLEFNELNQAQATVPDCAEVLLNHNGTAPGLYFEREGKVVVSLPGVPFEMKPLLTEEVLPRVAKRFALRAVVHRTAVTFGMAESSLALKIADWEDALPEYLHLAYLPNPSNIRLRLSAYNVEGATADAEIAQQFEALEKIIPDYVVGYGEVTLQSVVARRLKTGNKTLSVAESCTGGALSARFTAMPGASEYFLGGVVSYCEAVKMNVLGVERETLAKYGAVSKQVAEQMALGVRRLCGSDYAIATTGVAGPAGGTEETPVGLVWAAVAYDGGVVAGKMNLSKLRAQNIERASANAINMLRLLLSGRDELKLVQGML